MRTKVIGRHDFMRDAAVVLGAAEAGLARPEITPAQKQGGIVASREYEEMRIANLKAVGRAIRDAAKANLEDREDLFSSRS